MKPAADHRVAGSAPSGKRPRRPPRLKARIRRSKLYRVMHRAYEGWKDRQLIWRAGVSRLPPPFLRRRVHGSTSYPGYLGVGKRCRQDLEAALARIDRDLSSFSNVLDFGCGCGRTLIWFAANAGSCSFHGTDVDSEAISWCRANLSFADFKVNEPLPPLPYGPESFDLIYAISVFTHLNEDYQFRWLRELSRVLKPGGILISTVHGEHIWMDLPADSVLAIRDKGFLFITRGLNVDGFPEWYQQAYHSEDYVRRRYVEYFDLLQYVPRGMNEHQDLVVLQAAK